MRRQTGFTIIELMIVFSIIALLAAFLVPSLIGQTTDAKFVKARMMLADDAPNAIASWLSTINRIPAGRNGDNITSELVDFGLPGLSPFYRDATGYSAVLSYSGGKYFVRLNIAVTPSQANSAGFTNLVTFLRDTDANPMVQRVTSSSGRLLSIYYYTE